jgi:hypothetical protein
MTAPRGGEHLSLNIRIANELIDPELEARGVEGRDGLQGRILYAKEAS